MSAEATVVKNYLDWLISIPWNENIKVDIDLIKARKILDADHFGLAEVKEEQIIEFLPSKVELKNQRVLYYV